MMRSSIIEIIQILIIVVGFDWVLLAYLILCWIYWLLICLINWISCCIPVLNSITAWIIWKDVVIISWMIGLLIMCWLVMVWSKSLLNGLWLYNICLRNIFNWILSFWINCVFCFAICGNFLVWCTWSRYDWIVFNSKNIKNN